VKSAWKKIPVRFTETAFDVAVLPGKIRSMQLAKAKKVLRRQAAVLGGDLEVAVISVLRKLEQDEFALKNIRQRARKLEPVLLYGHVYVHVARRGWGIAKDTA
jgi:hypothetical protein